MSRECTRDGRATALLLELLNQMEGLAEDAEVLFLLTSNRPDLLEPALAVRPGRVDQAIELPLHSEACRRRPFDLFAHGLTPQTSDLDRFVKRADAASGAFIRGSTALAHVLQPVSKPRPVA